jgi:FkbM family methyltransferase
VATGFTEPGDQRVLGALAGGDTLLVDVGANIGLYSVTAAARGARVVAYEPAATTSETLRRNLEMFETATVRQVAVGARAGTGSLSGEGVGASLSHEGSPVEIVRLDEESLPTSFFSIVKIDAEGHDLDVLKGATDLLAQRRPVVLIESWHGGVEIRELLEPLGFLGYRTTRAGRLDPLSPSDQGHGNLVFIPKERLAEVHRRVAEAAPLVAPRVRFRAT